MSHFRSVDRFGDVKTIPKTISIQNKSIRFFIGGGDINNWLSNIQRGICGGNICLSNIKRDMCGGNTWSSNIQYGHNEIDQQSAFSSRPQVPVNNWCVLLYISSMVRRNCQETQAMYVYICYI